MGLFTRRKTVFVDSDILVIGGGMAGCGATYESRYWGRDLKIVCVEKANIERSGAVAQGLYAINCYMGMQWNENQPEDHVRYARNDLMGLVREDPTGLCSTPGGSSLFSAAMFTVLLRVMSRASRRR
jgi:succinate dehydrogenase/fumarate reductase flavoprotein subunit